MSNIYQGGNNCNKKNCKNIEDNACANCEKISCASISDIMESVALEQTAISHILNSEGEKLQKALAGNPSIEEMLDVNCSIQRTLEEVTSLEIILLNKLRAVVNLPCGDKGDGCFTARVTSCETQKPICKAKVVIFDCKNVIVGEGETDSCGVYTLCKIPFGKYKAKITEPKCKEVKYVDFCLTCETPNVTKNICFNIEEKDGKILVIVKSCDCGEDISDAQIKISYAGEEVDSGFTDENGEFLSVNLKAKEYLVEAVDVVNCETKSKTVCVKENETAKVEFCFEDEIKKITLSGKVTDSCRIPLERAKVQVTGKTTEITYTDCNGNYTFLNLGICDKFKIFAVCDGASSPIRTITKITAQSVLVNLVIKI